MMFGCKRFIFWVWRPLFRKQLGSLTALLRLSYEVNWLVSGYLSLLRSWCYARCICRLLIGWERLYDGLMTCKTIDKFFPRMSRYVNSFLFHLIMRIFKRTWVLKNIQKRKMIAMPWLISSGKSLFNDFLFFWERQAMEKCCEIISLALSPIVFQRLIL